jgi:hypothetical protein
MRHGRGVYTYPSEKDLRLAEINYPNIIIDFYDSVRLSFSGEWEEDVKVRGLIICRDGETYEGQLIDD